MEIEDVVNKLIGPIEPVGDSGIDVKRFQNLSLKIKLVDHLLHELWEVSKNKDSHEDSVKKIGESADKALNSIGNEYAFTKIGELESTIDRLKNCLSSIEMTELDGLKYSKIEGESLTFWELKDKLIKKLLTGSSNSL